MIYDVIPALPDKQPGKALMPARSWIAPPPTPK